MRQLVNHYVIDNFLWTVQQTKGVTQSVVARTRAPSRFCAGYRNRFVRNAHLRRLALRYRRKDTLGVLFQPFDKPLLRLFTGQVDDVLFRIVADFFAAVYEDLRLLAQQ